MISLNNENNFDNYCYLEPRMNHLLVTSEGLIFDKLENNYEGLWDKNFKLVKLYKGLLETNSGFFVKALLQNNLLLNEKNFISLIDLNTGSKIEIWNCNMNMQCLDFTNHKQPRLLGVSDGQFVVWNMKNITGKSLNEPIFNLSAFNSPPTKVNNHLELVRTLKTRFAFCDNILALDNGVVLGKNNEEGSVFYIDFEKEEVNELQSTQGTNVIEWAKIGWDSVAMGRNQNILIIQFKSQVGHINNILRSGNDELFQGIQMLPNDRLASVNQKGELRIWDVKSGKCLKTQCNITQKSQSQYHLRIVDQSTLLIYSHEEKCLSLIKINDELPLKLESYINLKARIRNVSSCQKSPCEKYLLIVQDCGTFRKNEVSFKPELEIHAINETIEKTFQRKKFIEDGKFETLTVTFNKGTFIRKSKKIDEEQKSQEVEVILNDEPYIQYIIGQPIGTSLLVQWYFNQDQTVTHELLVGSYHYCQSYHFDRMVFSYSYDKLIDTPLQQSNSDNSYNMFDPIPIKKKQQQKQNCSGIVVYNADQVMQVKIPFEQQFIAKVFEMSNANFLYFLNSMNSIEVWNIQTQALVQKADCKPSTINQIKFQQEQPHLLFLNGSGEWIVRTQKLGLICKRKTDKTNIKKVEFFDEDTCIVLHGKKKLQLWNLKDNKVDDIIVDFDLCDFFVWKELQQKFIVVVGDYSMKKINISQKIV